MWFKTLGSLALAAACCAATGCGRGEPQGKVHGKVTLAGEPVPAGLVIFSNAERGVHMTAPLQSDGSYELQTAQGFGLPLGDYRVAVNPPLMEPAMPGAPPPPAVTAVPIPAKYRRVETSGLSLSVGPGDNPFDIVLSPAP